MHWLNSVPFCVSPSYMKEEKPCTVAKVNISFPFLKVSTNQIK